MNSTEKQKIRLVGPKDLEISYFVGSGHGGQNKQKCHSGTQIFHKESGAIGRASDTRSQDQNKRAAFDRLIKSPKFKLWLNKKLMEIDIGESLEAAVEKDTTNDKLKFEIKKDGKWIEVSAEYFESPEAKTSHE